MYVVHGTKFCRLPKNTWPLVIIGMSPSINSPADSTLHISEPVFVDLLRSPRIDSHPGGPEWQPYLSYWPARLHRLAKSIPRNRVLGSINIYKYGLRISSGHLPSEEIKLVFMALYCVFTSSVLMGKLNMVYSYQLAWILNFVEGNNYSILSTILNFKYY